MSLLFETIKVFDKKAYNLKYHQIRMQRSIKRIFNKKRSFNLQKLITPSSRDFYRCKIIYSDKIEDISFYEYYPRKIESFKLIKSDIEYNYKFLNREEIDELFLQRGSCDEIIIVRNGKITDTSIANIAFFDSRRWITPKSPLLKGTTRARLLEKKKILARDIYIEEIKFMEKIAVMNALIGFKIINNFKIERGY